MPRPGTDIRVVDGAPQGGAILDTGQAFFAGVSQKGSGTQAGKVSSLADYEAKYGVRSGGSLLYDAVAAFFAEGGANLYVGRAVGAGGTSASIAFGSSMTAKAASPGTWGNSLTVESQTPSLGSGVIVIVKQSGTIVAQSPNVSVPDDVIAWAQNSPYVTFTKSADTALGVIAAVTLAGGADGGLPGTSEVAAALALFEYGLGPGQVAAPGYTTLAVQQAVLAHVDATRRVALIDLPDTADPTALVAAATALRTTKGVRFSLGLAPWINYPASDLSGIVRAVPFSAIQAALTARADTVGANPNQPAAGANGIHRLSVGLTQNYTDAQRQSLNEQGIALAKLKYGSVRTYGYRTLAGPADKNWLWFGNSRVLMAIAHDCDAVAENYVLRQIDGRRQVFAALETDLRGVLLDYFRTGALYGENPADAFAVDVGAGVNTIDTIKAGEIHAVVRVKTSPAGEWVAIDIVKVPIEAALAA